MNRTVLVALIFAILAGFAVWWIWPRPLPEVVICERLIPGVSQVGLKFGRAENGGVSVDFGTSGTTTTASPDALKAFMDCLREQNAAKSVTIVHGVNIPIEPIGEVADHWKGDDDLRLTLMPGGDDKILNNLRIGPAVGRKQDIIRNWCSPDQAGACVTCAPENPTDTTNYVEVHLRPEPKVDRQQLP